MHDSAGREEDLPMHRTIPLLLAAVALALVTSGCDVASTAVRTTGKAAADTTRAAGEVGETAAHGTANAVEKTTREATDRD
jgi:hypothetical protein